jgi:hypothetical protein
MEHSENPITERALVFECNERGRIICSDYRDETLRVCRAASKHDNFIGAAVLLADPDQSLIFTAGAGDGIEVMKGVKISTVENTSRNTISTKRSRSVRSAGDRIAFFRERSRCNAA